MITSNLKFKTVNKDRLFYDQYQYSACIPLKESTALRGNLSHDAIDQAIERRQTYWAMMRNSIVDRRIDDSVVAQLHDICDFLLALTDEYKLVFNYNHWLTIYTNSLTIINQVNALDFIANKTYSQVNVNRPRDTILLKNSKHTKRSYFREFAINSNEKEILTNFFESQQDYIRISPGLKNWMNRGYRYNYVYDYFFVDYSEDLWLTMLNLVRPGIIRKTVEILQDK